LFEKALSDFRKRDIPESVLVHYLHTVTSLLRSATDVSLLLRYSTFRHRRTRYDRFYAEVWAVAWLRLLELLDAHQLEERLPDLRKRFVILAGTRQAGAVSSSLKRRNKWKPLARLLQKEVGSNRRT
jgi:hypothetical protein